MGVDPAESNRWKTITGLNILFLSRIVTNSLECSVDFLKFVERTTMSKMIVRVWDYKSCPPISQGLVYHLIDQGPVIGQFDIHCYEHYDYIFIHAWK